MRGVWPSMNAPIRTVEDLIAAIRSGQIERELSDERFEDIAGLPKGSVAKYLGPARAKGLGSISLPLMLGGLGKALVLVDDQEQIEKVKGRWVKRNIVGGSAIQMLGPVASRNATKRDGSPIKTEENGVFALMQMLGKKGGKASGKTRKAKAERRKALQRVRSHAARMRWARKSVPTP